MNSSQKLGIFLGLIALIAGIGLFSLDRWSEMMYKISGSSDLDASLARRSITPERLEEAGARLREGEQYLRQNSEASAREAQIIFNRVLSWNLTAGINQEAQYGLAVALDRLGEHQAALDHYRALRLEDLENPEIAEKLDYQIGRKLLEMGHNEEGRSILDSLLARTADNRLKSEIHTAFGYNHLDQRRRQRSLESFRVALKYNPDSEMAEVGYQFARESKEGQSYTQRYQIYRDRILGSEPQPSRSREPDHESEPRQATRTEPQRNGTAAQQPAATETSDERSAAGRAFDAGMSSFRAANYSGAANEFRKSLLVDPDSADGAKAAYWLAESYMRSGRNDLALQYYDHVIANRDRSFDQPALIQKGILHFRNNRLVDALADFQRAIRDYPDGDYSDKAEEWRRELEIQIEESRMVEEFSEGGASR